MLKTSVFILLGLLAVIKGNPTAETCPRSMTVVMDQFKKNMEMTTKNMVCIIRKSLRSRLSKCELGQKWLEISDILRKRATERYNRYFGN
ncbi:hypothetical protein PHET_01334 [Paragonimus heterotremus]|uniref:Uncharacterized protein n=1 Tax=Paragonimus heterotremus TaxID=100268 RepID=A0A8J4WUN4_9TREM|nr:hypothetical protein PHET_01334 [Paragonimus heterotremus]